MVENSDMFLAYSKSQKPDFAKFIPKPRFTDKQHILIRIGILIPLIAIESVLIIARLT